MRLLVEQHTRVVTSEGAYPTFNFHVAAQGGVIEKVPYADDREDPEALLAKAYEVNPSIIYASNSGFGPEGDWSRNGSMDAVCQAMSGAAVAQGGGPSHEPVLIENCPADQSGAWNFAFSIVSALFHRERTGRGQWLQTSQL